MYGDEKYYEKFVEAGVKGFVLKTAGLNEFKAAVSEIANNGTYFSNELLLKIIQNNKTKREEEKKQEDKINLSTRELEVLKLMCSGLTNEEIAEKLFISPRTVKVHRTNLLEKTGSNNTPSLIIYAIRNKLIEL